VVIAFVGSFAVKYSVGESSPPPPQPSFLRFQVLNGCGVNGAAANFARHLRNLSTAEIVIDVIDEGNFTSYDQEKTLLIVREASIEETEKVVELVGVSSDRIIEKRLDDNFLDINFTMVLGRDFVTYLDSTEVN
jgi:hypothetical protein